MCRTNNSFTRQFIWHFMSIPYQGSCTCDINALLLAKFNQEIFVLHCPSSIKMVPRIHHNSLQGHTEWIEKCSSSWLALMRWQICRPLSRLPQWQQLLRLKHAIISCKSVSQTGGRLHESCSPIDWCKLKCW